MKTIAYIFGFFVVLFLFIGVMASIDGTPVIQTEKQKWENAASECWKSYERKSLTPMEKINVALFCEGLSGITCVTRH